MGAAVRVVCTGELGTTSCEVCCGSVIFTTEVSESISLIKRRSSSLAALRSRKFIIILLRIRSIPDYLLAVSMMIKVGLDGYGIDVVVVIS